MLSTKKLESIQYNAVLAITVAVRGSSKEKLYQELDLESLQQCQLLRNFCDFLKITNNPSPKYLFDKIPATRAAYRTRYNTGNIPWYNVEHTFFKNSFFPSTVLKWNNLDKSIKSSKSSPVHTTILKQNFQLSQPYWNKVNYKA